jgi:hypothetical protein
VRTPLATHLSRNSVMTTSSWLSSCHPGRAQREPRSPGPHTRSSMRSPGSRAKRGYPGPFPLNAKVPGRPRQGVAAGEADLRDRRMHARAVRPRPRRPGVQRVRGCRTAAREPAPSGSGRRWFPASLEASSDFLRPLQVPWAILAAPRDGVFCLDYATSSGRLWALPPGAVRDSWTRPCISTRPLARSPSPCHADCC